ncbi:MAG: radical SAM protein [Candidatus Aminicenantes bacterium]|nr:radical SAM protein [Candidatus Aminicenantes bacterium]
MSIELRPLGVECNLGCQYCYQNMHRDAGNGTTAYDLAAMKAAIEEQGGPFHLFGGEPLLMNEDDLEEMFRWGCRKYGQNCIQTNGALLDDNHIRMFKQYAVDVGLSIDGPGPLNDVRWAGTLEKTRRATEKSQQAISRLLAAGIEPGIMIQVTRCNCSAQRLPQMYDWVRELDRLGICSMRLHILEIENHAVRQKYGLSIEENVEILLSFFELEKELKNMRFDLSSEMKDLLLAKDSEASCIWRACDPYTTDTVNGVDGNGKRHNCGLTDKEGIDFQKPDSAGFERYIALYHTPQEHGGCKDCRFFLVCKGHCPGTAIDRDWRNRTEYCQVWKQLFTHLEGQLVKKKKKPITLHRRRKQWGKKMLDLWACGDDLLLETDLEDSNRTGSEAVSLEQHEFLRVTWVSSDARQLWEPRLEQIKDALDDLKYPLIAAGIRPLILERIYPYRLAGLRRRLKTMAVPHDGAPSPGDDEIKQKFFGGQGGDFTKKPPCRRRQSDFMAVKVVPLEMSAGELSRFFLTPFPEDDRQIFILIGSGERIDKALTALAKNDWTAFHDQCGTPRCCSESLRDLKQAKSREPAWAMAQQTAGQTAQERLCHVPSQWQTNPVLYPLGLELLNHYPCHGSCCESMKQSEGIAAFGIKQGKKREIEMLKNILSWSMSWSTLHGITEIKTPVFKFITNAQPTASRHEVRFHGASFPEKGARGLGFPYRQPSRLSFSESEGFKRGLENPIH